MPIVFKFKVSWYYRTFQDPLKSDRGDVVCEYKSPERQSLLAVFKEQESSSEDVQVGHFFHFLFLTSDKEVVASFTSPTGMLIFFLELSYFVGLLQLFIHFCYDLNYFSECLLLEFYSGSWLSVIGRWETWRFKAIFNRSRRPPKQAPRRSFARRIRFTGCGQFSHLFLFSKFLIYRFFLLPYMTRIMR